MDEAKRKIYEFGGFRLDALRLALEHADGTPIPLKPKACEILLALIERQGQVVSKEELMRAVWPDSYVEESNLTVNLSMLRKALGDNADRQQYIVTIPGRGYRFVGEAGPSLSGPAKAIPVRRKRGLLYTSVLAALLLVSLGIYGFFYFRRSTPPPFKDFRLTRLTTSGHVMSAAVSPDGRYVAYIAAESGGQSVWLKQLGAASDVQIIPRESEVHFAGLTFSDDGENLYLLKSGKGVPNALYRTATLGGALEKLAGDVDSLPAISPDGKTLAFIRGLPDQNETALFIVSTAGGESEKMASRPSTEGFGLAVRPIWTPDGQEIIAAVGKKDEKGKYMTLAAIDPRTRTAREPAAPRFIQITQMALAPDSGGLLVAGQTEDSPSLNQIVYFNFPGTAYTRITNDLNDYRELSLTADGKSMVTINTDLQTNLWLLPGLDTKRAVQVTNTNYDGARGVAWMPDGSLIYTSRSAESLDLWTLAPDGAKQQLTSFAGNNFHPAVSPDGKFIAFVSDRSGSQSIWIANADGSDPVQLTVGIEQTAPSWSPDGKGFAYTSYINGNPAVFGAGQNPGQLTQKISGRPQYSPDSSKILCTYRAEALAPQRLAIISAQGGEPETLFNFTSGLFRWAEKGQAILFVNQLADGGVNLWRQPLDPATSPVKVTDWDGMRIYWFDISPDGKTIACARGTSQSDAVLITQTSEPK
jgi:Tol biopolymer transport system component/DNA-binding winged helix-turn-helix (wHTH) protein